MSLKFRFVYFLMITLRLDILDKNTIEVMLCPFHCVILGKRGGHDVNVPLLVMLTLNTCSGGICSVSPL